MSIPKDVGQIPVYYSRSYISRNRNYLLMDSKPLYLFGFGLSYTTFAYGDLEAAFSGEELVVSFTVTNTGERKGEVPQLYVTDLVAPGPAHAGAERLSVDQPYPRAGPEAYIPPSSGDAVVPARGKWITEPGDFRCRWAIL